MISQGAAAGRLPLTFALALALGGAGCVTSPAPRVTANVTNAPVSAGINIPPGSGEDFIVNVGRRVYFAENQTTLDATAKATLDKQAEWLTRHPGWKVKIQGFSDEPGSAEHNVAVALKRAEAVRDHLASRGVAQARMRVKTYGRDRLVRDCPDVSCKSQNRRVITNLEGDEDV